MKKVLFGSRQGTSVKVASSKKLTVVVPAGKAGWVNVRVVTATGTSAKSKKVRYRYVAPTPAPSRLSAIWWT